MSGTPPPMVDALQRGRRRRPGTRLWTCCAGRAGTRIRSEALHRILTSDAFCRGSRRSASLPASGLRGLFCGPLIPPAVTASMAGIVVKPRARIFHGHDWVYASEVLKAFGDP